MVLLDTVNKSLEIVLGGVVTTNQLPFVATFADHDAATPTFSAGELDGLSNSTTSVTVVAAPASGQQRQLKFLSVFNDDTVAAVVTVQYNSTGGTLRTIVTFTLEPGFTLIYNDGEGFMVMDTTGGTRGQDLSGFAVKASAETITGSWTFSAVAQFSGGISMTGAADIDMLAGNIRNFGFIESAGSGATKGAVRLGNNEAIVAEDSAGSDATLMVLNATDRLLIGAVDTETIIDIQIGLVGMPTAFGAAPANNVNVLFGGAFISGGVGASASAVRIATDLTGAVGDTAYLTLLDVGSVSGGSITTQGGAAVIANVAAVTFSEPDITLVGGTTITNASTVRITGAPTEGVRNWALRVDSGASVFQGSVLFGGGQATQTLSTFLADHATNGIEILGSSDGAVVRLTNPGNLSADERVGMFEFVGNDASTTSSDVAGRFGMFADSGWGSTHPEGMFIWETADGASASAEKMRLTKFGQLWIGAALTGSAQLHVRARDSTTVGLKVDTAASPSEAVAEFYLNGALQWQMHEAAATGHRFILTAFDNDAGLGRQVRIEQNNDGATPAAGHIALEDLGGSVQYFWPDNSASEGVLRQSTTAPTNAANVGGVIVGDQTSWHEAKRDIVLWDGAGAVARIMGTPLYEYNFRNPLERRNGKRMQGVVIYEEDRGSAWWSMNDNPDQTPAMDEAAIMGNLLAMAQIHERELEILRGEIRQLKEAA